jgi:hypothetical protein
MLILKLDLEFLSFSLALKGAPNLDIRTLFSARGQNQRCGYLLQPQHIQTPSTCSIRSLYEGTPVHFRAGS